MQVTIWGTRGSRPAASGSFYGSDTACLEVRTRAGDVILLDAGTGIHAYAKAHPNERPVICLSHLHLDHVQGLPFYAGTYDGGQVIYTPDDRLRTLFDGILTPVRMDAVKADIRKIETGDSFRIGSATIETASTNHPGGCLSWKITADGWTFVYGADHELPAGDAAANSDLARFMTGADVALVDAHFSEEDHLEHPGWGHSHMLQWPETLKNARVGAIVFSHFHPDYPDGQISVMLEEVRARYPQTRLFAARAGCQIDKDGPIATRRPEPTCPACAFFKKTASLYDSHAVVNALLTEAREICHADAGTIYLVENGELSFTTTQNDTLFPNSAANKFSYLNAKIAIDKTSIAGYVASTGKVLNISDVYELHGAEYDFNRSFDEANGYRTGSMLTAPLLNGKNRVVGVIQLINSTRNGKFVPFTSDMEKTIVNLGAMATIPLERSLLVTDMILRMLRTSALRDPSETAGHVYRVGGICAELYHRWAEAHNVEPEELMALKGRLRLAAMLHDVGKVGIPDAILKKPGKLDDEERAKMMTHAALGANLFADGASDIERMALEIALHHHAKWDGSGYTGDKNAPSPAGKDIPLWARLTAIADVYDALVSPRCYKKGWEPEKALEILHKDAGSHFDPELVRYFDEIKETIDNIMKRYEG